jgi:hypothetical protein
LTNLFFSTLPNEYERIFKEELWGCFKYIGIPMDTLMNMPIADRKFYIMLHNRTEGGSSDDDMSPPQDSEKFNMMRNVKDWH